MIQLLKLNCLGFTGFQIAACAVSMNNNGMLNLFYMIISGMKMLLGEAKERMRNQRKRGKNMGGFKGKRNRW